MPLRRIVLATGETYHVYNRSIAGEEYLKGKKEEKQLLGLFDYYRFHQKISFSKFKLIPKTEQATYIEIIKRKDPQVKIFAFSLMPDHFHLLL